MIASLPGDTFPEREIILCAHYDSAGPGATDNASGVGVLLEAARILSQHRFEKTMVHRLFG